MKEPVFILRAQDVYAPQTIIEWARVVIASPNATRVHFDKATEALAVANKMLEWQQLNPDKVKIPDLNYCHLYNRNPGENKAA